MTIDRAAQKQKAEVFLSLHHSDSILILPNAWDVASAQVFASAGFSAIGTTGTGIALSYGHKSDGAPLDEMLWIASRMVERVSLPVTLDIDEGFGSTIPEILETIDAVLAIGAVGINIDDRVSETDSSLLEPTVFCERLAAIRERADSAGVHLVINARSDVFLSEIGEPRSRLSQAIERGNAYRAAAADCIFIPGKGLDESAIKSLAKEIDAPLNISANPTISNPPAPPIPRLQELGVARVSIGAAATKVAIARTRKIAEELMGPGSYESLRADV